MLFVGAFLVLCCCFIVPSEVGGRGFYLLSFVGALLLFDCTTKQLHVVVYDHKTAEFSGVKKSVDKRSIFVAVKSFLPLAMIIKLMQIFLQSTNSSTKILALSWCKNAFHQKYCLHFEADAVFCGRKQRNFGKALPLLCISIVTLALYPVDDMYHFDIIEAELHLKVVHQNTTLHQLVISE